MMPKKPTIKNKVEALLFSVGKKISLDEISRLCRSKKEEIMQALHELQKEYDDKQSSLMLMEEGEFWKITVRDNFIPIVKKVVTETELPKSVLETLAVIAFKYPILQSDLIKVRTNKAYDHLTELESSGYISRQKHGRTNLIKLTEKFFRYFDLTEEKLKEKFKDFDSIAKAINEKEDEVEKLKEEQRKKAEELKKEDEKIKKEIELLDAEEEAKVALEVYETTPKEVVSEDFVKDENLIVEKEKIGELDIVEEEQFENNELQAQEGLQMKEGLVEESDKISEQEGSQESDKHPQFQNGPQQKEGLKEVQQENQQQETQSKYESKGIKLVPEMEAIVDKKVEKILHPEKEEK